MIDIYSSREAHWSNINHKKIGQYGIYNLWRIEKNDLKKYSNSLIDDGYQPNWRDRKVEKF